MQTLQALNAHFSLSDNGTIMAELIARSEMLNRVLSTKER